jgi:peptidoglycan/xylan/chitin deacetylase (PgdA/CDA1 family)
MSYLDNLDFSLPRFRQICETISRNYPTITVLEYFENPRSDKFIIMRHDIDRFPGNALKTASIEHELGIKATYYFRSNKGEFHKNVIKQIKEMGHEIGYHYEVLSETNGDPEKAIELFRSNLKKLREICDVKTICMHGRPLSSFDNRDLWKIYNYKDYGIIGEAYLSVGDELNYFSDTGRCWGLKDNMRDYIPGNEQQIDIDSTGNLIKLIESKELNNLYILTHPERWSSDIFSWGAYYSMDRAVNLGKNILIKYGGRKNRLHVDRSLSITVDIEDWYHIPSVCGSDFSVYKDVKEFFEKWEGRYDYLSEPTKRVLNILDEFNMTATFFIVADVAEHYPGLIESIAARGHEIACHGADHRCSINPNTKKPLLTIEEFEQSTKEAKRILEKASGQEVIGFRAPNAAVTGQMLDSLRKMGFKYDSSVAVNSLYNKTDSSLNFVSTVPYYPAMGSLEPATTGDLIEFPWSYYDVGIKIPTSGGPMLRFLGANLILKGIRQSLNRGHTIFYFHPIDICKEEFPKVGKGRPFYWIIKGDIVEQRIRYILRNLDDVKVVPLRDLATKLKPVGDSEC